MVEVKTADAVVKGQTASSSFKNATTTNDIKILVPPHIKEGDKIIINTDNYEYLEPNVSLKCGGGKALISQHIGHDMSNLNMYDIDAKSLMKKQVLGDIKEIDAIHNNIDNNHMNFHKIQVMTMRNSMERSHYRMNEKVLQGKERSFLDDDFFRGDFNRDYFVPPTRIDRSRKTNFEKKWNKSMGN